MFQRVDTSQSIDGLNVRHHHYLISSLSMNNWSLTRRLTLEGESQVYSRETRFHVFRKCNKFHKGNNIQERDLIDSKNSPLSYLNLVAHFNYNL